jgi:hypothetical protein
MTLTNANLLETRGAIIKEEKVKSLSEKILPDTLVLENYEPFPGYFGKDVPTDVIPRSIFLILVREYEPLPLGRVIKQVSSERKHKCHGAMGYLDIGEHRYHCIRLHNLHSFDDIPQIQESFRRHGIEFRRHKSINEMALITIHKTFFIERIAEGIFLDLAEQSRHYFPIKAPLTWDQFKHITRTVKNNMDNNFFDAAIGYFWTLDGPLDVIRIYDKKNDFERILDIKHRYDSEIERWLATHPR